MKIFNSIQDFKSTSKTIVTLGTFDGVHIGHKKILTEVVRDAKSEGCESLVLTFFPHPRMVLQADSDIKLLHSIEEKSNFIGQIGIDNLVIHPFDTDFSRLTAEEFVKNILVNIFKIKKIMIGHDHRFGRNRTAKFDDLVDFGKQYGFDVEQILPQEINEIAVSSTKIRNAIIEGQIKLANKFLGYNYLFSGTVVKGKQLGRTLGFPTANIKLDFEYKLIPKNGVYVVQSCFNGKVLFGMMNIGFNPTLDGKVQTIEVFFFDFDEDLYLQKLSISVIDRLRDERKFNSLDELKNQLKLDQINSLFIITSK